MPQISAFPACCGATILTGFSCDPTGQAGYKLDPLTMRYALDKDGKNIPITYEEQFTTSIEKYFKQYPGYMYSCILNTTQAKAYDWAWPKLLKKLGFECVRRWTNSQHQDVEFLYLFVLCTDQKGKCENDFTRPPEGWDAMPGPEQAVALAKAS